jgi:hypothetical protein
MNSFRVKLSAAEFADLNGRFPPSRGSGDIGKRAVEIVKGHFNAHYPGSRFVDPPRGADISLILFETADPKLFEVKGTAEADIAWQQLKVSGQASHDLLTSGSATVLRVTDVYSEEPVVFELRHGQDFRLEPEARWTFKRIPVE